VRFFFFTKFVGIGSLDAQKGGKVFFFFLDFLRGSGFACGIGEGGNFHETWEGGFENFSKRELVSRALRYFALAWLFLLGFRLAWFGFAWLLWSGLVEQGGIGWLG